MSATKRFFANIKEFFAVLNWNIRIAWQRFKEWCGRGISKAWNAITMKEKRDAKKNAKYQRFKEHLEIDNPDIDVRYDIDVQAAKDQIKVEIEEAKEAGNEELEKELKEVYKCAPVTKKQRARREKTKETFVGWGKGFIYLVWALVPLLIFTFYPIINALRLSFFKYHNDVTNQVSGFTLFGNFKKVLTEPNFIAPTASVQSSVMLNTLIIVVISVPVTIIIALAIAVALNSIKPLKSVFQTIFFLPYITNALALGLVFFYIFKTDGGLFNKFLALFGIEGGSWVSHGATYGKAMFVLLLFSVWKGLAFKIMVFISAIQGIDEQYYQAAAIDATPRFKQFRRITVPLISPTILYITITSVIGAFKTYSSVIAIFNTSGKPAGANFDLKTIVFYVYEFMSKPGGMPQAAATSIILFIIILLMTWVQNAVSKKRVHY